ncbi:hypothetical protein [Pedobacter glucosidilyticus]|uniref:hypothetical protein n=1 Tax=Pedobacter glucosidilyticus TaxID=1122941 RepID=UPI0004153386|nr:hypothetical protein [Pedobacter glucosidilyticus]
MKKVLITAASNANAYQLAYHLPHHEILFADTEGQKIIIPDGNKSSFAHELLSLCLDLDITLVFPLKLSEQKALAEAKVLFEEYGISLALPDLIQAQKIHQLKHLHSELSIPYETVVDFASFSKAILALGYPEKKIAISQYEGIGDLIIIKDDVKNDFFNGLKFMPFTLAAKVLNQNPFTKIHVYPLHGNMQAVRFIKLAEDFVCLNLISDELKELIQSLTTNLSLFGFYELFYCEDKIIRLNLVTVL